MKCPICQTWVSVLETRAKPNNERYRRYLCANEHRFSTREAVVAKESNTKPENTSKSSKTL